MPPVFHNRDGDNWEPLLFVANLAGGHWPKLIEQAAAELMQVERKPTVNVRLLKSIWEIYQPDPKTTPKPETFIPTADLLAKLISDKDEDWGSLQSTGRAITPNWLADSLRNLLKPPGTLRPDHTCPRGYAFGQFADALARYVGTHPALDSATFPIASSDQVGPVGPTPENSSKTAKIPGPTQESVAGPGPTDENRAGPTQPTENTGENSLGPTGPAKSGESTRDREAASSGLTAAAEGPSPGLRQKLVEHLSFAGNPQQNPAADLSVARPNGQATPKAKRRTPIERIIIETAARHPDWSAKQISKKVGRTESVVKRILESAKTEERPS
jgi:hypothetical protein